MRLFKCFKI